MLTQVRAQEAYDGLKLFGKLTLAILGWLSFFRLLLYIFVLNQNKFPLMETLVGFWMGFRFDLLVLGFLWIPFIFFVWLAPLKWSPRKLLPFFKIYWLLQILLIFNLSWMDIFWTEEFNVRLNDSFKLPDSFEVLGFGWEKLGFFDSIFVTFLMVFSTAFLLHFLVKLDLKKTFHTPSARQTILRAIASLLLVAFSARGTLTPHHLELAHAQISNDPLLNQLPLNAMWNMDKPAIQFQP